MAFTVEDGSSKQDANSLTTLAYFRTYCTDRGYTDQAAWSDQRTQVNLVKATDYLQQKWGPSFSGKLTVFTQALCWPRSYAYVVTSDDSNSWNYGGWLSDFDRRPLPSNVVPNQVQAATCELALVADTQDLAPLISKDEMNTISEKVGPIEVKYSSTRRQAYDVVRKASMLLRPLIVFGSSQVRIGRG